MALSTLKQRHFGIQLAYDEITAIEFIIDGAHYLRAIPDELDLTQTRDRVYIVGWFFEPTMDLTSCVFVISGGNNGSSDISRR